MRPVSSAFLETLRGSHTFESRARVCETFQTGTAPTGTEISIIAGSVRLDGTANVRSTIDITVDGTALWPTRADSLLAPYGNEIFVERGVAYGSGTTEWCSLGYFRIQTPEQDRPPDGPIRIQGLDRMAGIIDARVLAPVQFTAVDTYESVVEDLVFEVYPSATIQWDDATGLDTLGRSLIVEEDRFDFIDELVRGLGKIWYWDHRGFLIITDPPDTTAPVYDVNSGEDGVLVELSRQLTREGVYNAVVVLGEATDTETPARGVAVDANPESPTYFSGRFGPVPRYYSSPFIVTDAQANRVAESMLRQNLGLAYSIDFSTVPNPALEPFDAVRVRYSDRYSAEIHVLRDITVPLEAEEAMTATTREQTVILIGTPT